MTKRLCWAQPNLCIRCYRCKHHVPQVEENSVSRVRVSANNSHLGDVAKTQRRPPRPQRTAYTGYRCLRKKQPSCRCRQKTKAPPLPPISKLLSLRRQAPTKMAVFFADRSTPSPLSCNIEIRGRRGCSEALIFWMAVFFSQTPDSCFGEMVLQDDRIREQGFREAHVVDGTSGPDLVCSIRTQSVSVGLVGRGIELAYVLD